MNERSPESPMAASLRERAEKVFQEMFDSSLENLAALSPETLRASLHELRVHQIELELQNEEMRRAQAALDALRGRYFDLFDLAPVGYCTVSEPGLILEANLTAGTLLRVERGALVGRLLTAFISKEGQDLYYRCWKSLLDTHQPQECDLGMVRHDGTAFFAHLNFTVARDENAEPVCRVALSDITAHRQAEEARRESEERYRSLFSQASEGIFLLTPECELVDVNESFARMHGYNVMEMLHMGLKDLDTPETSQLVPARMRRLLDGEALTFEVEHYHKDGHVFPLEVSGSLISSHGRSLVQCFHRDITGRKAIEASLAAALQRAEAANRAKSEFLGVMSHELRTPLNSVLGFAQLLSDTPLDSEQKAYAETIGKSGEHLLAIVNDILDFSSIEAGTLAIHGAPLAVADLVRSAEDTVRKTAADKGLDLRCEVAAGVPEQITGDEQRIRQILINLLGNAVKFTASGSVILRVAPASDGGRRFLDFSVEDTGIGIASGTIGHLFKPFAQGDTSLNRSFGGTGLGLAISRRIAEAMGGSLTLVSAPGKGSTFTFRFPLEISS